MANTSQWPLVVSLVQEPKLGTCLMKIGDNRGLSCWSHILAWWTVCFGECHQDQRTGDMFDEDWGQQTPGGTLFLGTVPKIHHIWWEYEQNSSSFYQVWYFKWLIINLQFSLLSPPISPNGTTCFQHNSHILMGTIHTTLPAQKVARSWWNFTQFVVRNETQGGAGRC